MPILFIILLIIMIIVGLIEVIKPEIGWYLSEGWKFKNAEPSDTALLMARIGGVIVIIVALLMLMNIHQLGWESATGSSVGYQSIDGGHMEWVEE